MSRIGEKSSPIIIAAAWLVVTIPLAWGVYQTAKKSVPLFRMSAVVPEPAGSGAHR